MKGITNLDKLLKEMKPELIDKEYVFCTLPESKLTELKLIPLSDLTLQNARVL
ncbi:MAG: ACT domain-containing protein [Candidatus Micrarchaeota archaeon]